MNKPVSPGQLDLIPDKKPKAVNGADALATGLSPTEAATIEAIIAEDEPSADDFDWNNPDEDSIVIKPRPGIAVYRNRADDVVIRVQNTSDAYNEDHFAFIRPESLPAVIKALKDELQ